MAERMCGQFMSFPGNDRGLICNSVLIMEKLEVEKEFYISIDYDRSSQKPIITYSTRGGMSVEQIKKRYPNSIHQFTVEIDKGLDLSVLMKVAEDLGISEKQSALAFLIKNMFECFVQRDAISISINPLIYDRDRNF